MQLERASAERKVKNSVWTFDIHSSLLFEREGLELVLRAAHQYSGSANELDFLLKIDPLTYRDYYSLHETQSDSSSGILLTLPIRARKTGRPLVDRVVIDLPVETHMMPFPESLCPPTLFSQPKALLLPMITDFDLLFANQILLPIELRRAVFASPMTWLKAMAPSGGQHLRSRLGKSFSQIHPSAQVHPTAVVEGSWIGAGTRVGAHCVVRYSHIDSNVRLHDGAKVELSVVGRGSWLMHDLVLYRCHVEDEVFLIHGPYQFSSFQSRSGAFATIMMDYRPDAKPIRVATPTGVRNYAGRFLGAVLKPGSKTLGGSLLAPGQVVPENVWLSANPSDVHRIRESEVYPSRMPVAPKEQTGKS